MNFNFNFGEMTNYERMKLYNYIKLYNPNIILESGSGKGGSTYVMLNAINQNTKIYSCDPFRMPDFESKQIIFFLLKSDELIKIIKEKDIYPDFIFFDGPEDPDVALNDFKNLENYVKVGTIFSMHDWCTIKRKLDNNISTKALYLKPYINSLKSWYLLEETNGEKYVEGQESVGLCFYKKIE